MALTFVRIASVTVTGSATTTMEFTNVPQTYSDLLLKVSGRSTDTTRNFGYRFNGNVSTVYTDWLLYTTGSGTFTASRNNGNKTDYNYQSISTDTTNAYSNNEIYIANYSSTASNKAFIADSVVGTQAASGFLGHTCQSWGNTAAITNIEIIASGAFSIGSKAWLYGILRA